MSNDTTLGDYLDDSGEYVTPSERAEAEEPPIVQNNETCPAGAHRHIDPNTGRAMDPTVGDHSDSHLDEPTGEWTPAWVDELFDLLQQGLDVARARALYAADTGTSTDWANATQSVSVYIESVHKVGHAFGKRALELEVQGSAFLQALTAMLGSEGVHVIPVD